MKGRTIEEMLCRETIKIVDMQWRHRGKQFNGERAQIDRVAVRDHFVHRFINTGLSEERETAEQQQDEEQAM